MIRLTPTPSPSIEALLYHAQMQGILPLTSCCNTKCMFCSNAYNPPDCEVFTIKPRSFEEIQNSMSWLVGSRGPIVVGESVTRINEGEPLTHPEFLKILELVRKHYPERPIQVTTNALLLNPKLTAAIARLDVELMVSLNTIGFREEVMGDKHPEETLQNVGALSGKVKFEGSIVALPFVTGWKDIEDTAKFLKDSGAWSIRILSPGFSESHPLGEKVTPALCGETKDFSRKLSADLKIPVLFEPSGITSIDPVVEHVLPRSPARRAGIRAGDVIINVSKRAVMSRTEAFSLIRDTERPRVAYQRHGVLYETIIRKERFKASGLVMHDDIDPRAWFDWERKSGVKRRSVLVLTSAFAKPIIENALQKRGLSAKVKAVRSIFFGGNIEAAGLLTVRDFIAAYKELDSRDFEPHAVTLPQRAFDPWGPDLEGVSYKTFEEAIQKPVVLA